jgi:aspartyl-tRNA(Asn)/glutamyl-tRNA(Gln) amidotransferase subunit A
MTPLRHFEPITGLAPLLAAKTISSEDLTRACLGEIDAHNDRLRAFITVTADEAMAQARALDDELARGHHRGPLHGIPISLKDLIDQRGVPTTAASHVRDGHVAASDASITARLRDAGAVLIGKTNLHEFAFGTTSDDTAYGAVRNPHDPERSPGGSSGGSAVAIVTGMSVASIGTDTGGSIRIPSAACGVVGLKPTFGEISCDGIVPLSRSLDHAGPLARSVADAWLIYLVLRGDPSAARWPLPGRDGVKGLRIGVVRPYAHDILDHDVRERFAESMAWLRQAGAETFDVAIPHAAEIAATYLLASLPEASAYHAASVAARPERYTDNVRLRIEMGRYLLAEDYVRAQRGRDVLRGEVDRALEGCHVLALPTLPIPAPPIGATTVDVAGTPQSVRAMMLRLTQLFNLTGHPALSLPCGRTSASLPCGLQLVGRRHETETLLAAAAACEPVVTR